MTKTNSFLQNLIAKVDIPVDRLEFSDISEEYLELFAQLLGEKRSKTIYITTDTRKLDLDRVYKIKVGEKLNLDHLISIGYQRVERVWQEGELSILGDSITIWPFSNTSLLRISMWGESVENIDIVDEKNRRKIKSVESREIFDKESSQIVGNENQKQYQIVNISNDGFRLGINHIPGIVNFTDLHTTKKILKNFKNLGYEIWYTSKSLERYEKNGISMEDVIDKYFEIKGALDSLFERGVHFSKSKLILLTDLEVLGEIDISKYQESVSKLDPSSLEILKKIAPGDYLVHEDHGIGLFKGVKDSYIELQYAGRDRLLIPLSSADRVSKYIGANQAKPKLTGLNSGLWRRIEEGAKKKTESIAKELLQLYALRKSSTTNLVIENDSQLGEFWKFVSDFEFEDTQDQLIATNHILEDFQNSTPMDRLLVGDVGFGKTEIAMRAIFACVNAGYQVAILAPTTVLASQHLEVFNKRFSKYPFVIKSLSRFNTKLEKQKVLDGLKSGGIDIVVGTHSLLSKNIKFKNLGLIVVDEEQKFGVKQKEYLKKLRVDTNILSMTATPIPRTLNMALMGIRDISVLATPPLGRMDVKNEFDIFSWDRVRAVIERELKRDGQVFYLHNRVGNIEFYREKIGKMFPDARVGILHGQMYSRAIETVMSEFSSGKIDVLLCTTIIENGLDIPNANTLIIDDVNVLGLSQMYQIRGRIGRSNRQAYACFFFDKLRGKSELRLSALRESEELGSGFVLSNRDLEIRGAGDILGQNQSGVINSVGYGLYTQMLRESVEKLKGSI